MCYPYMGVGEPRWPVRARVGNRHDGLLCGKIQMVEVHLACKNAALLSVAAMRRYAFEAVALVELPAARGVGKEVEALGGTVGAV